jgi:K+-transporting ATPase ATPase A chain
MLVILAASLLLAWPLGLYLARVMRGTPMKVDGCSTGSSRCTRCSASIPRAMSWRGYVLAFVLSNVVVAVLTQAVFMTQAWLPLNPDQIPNMRWDTALHTMISFLTNTNQQHYSGQAQLSYLRR